MSYNRFVILIDDDPVLLYIVEQQFLKQLPGDQLLCFQEAEDAIEYLKDFSNPSPDFILLDINMPGMNGWDFLDVLNEEQLDLKRQLKVAILSSTVDPYDHSRADTYPSVVHFFTKPLNLDTLKVLLNNPAPASTDEAGS